MAQANWQKSGSTRNSVTDNSSRRNRNKPVEFKRLPLEVDAVDRKKIRDFMNYELEYYNRLVESFHARMRTQPEFIMSLVEDYEKTVGELAYTGFDVKLVSNNTDYELPSQLSDCSSVLLGRDGQGKRRLNDKLLTFYKEISKITPMLPTVRKHMALEMLKFYRNQSRASMKTSNNIDMVYQSSFSFLEKQDIFRKRHIQIINPKFVEDPFVKIWYNEKEEMTFIKTAYTTNAIKVSGDMANDGWRVMTVHQMGNYTPRLSDEFVAEFHYKPNFYLLGRQDQKSSHTGSMFAAAKKKTYKHELPSENEQKINETFDS